MKFRPHIMTWVPVGASTTDPVTGYQISGVRGTEKAVECRFYLQNIKEFTNEDNSVVQQKGRIRVDAGSELPGINSMVKIFEVSPIVAAGSIVTISGSVVNITGPVHFQGVIRDIFRGQLTWRLDV